MSRDNRGKSFFQKLGDWLDSLLLEDEPKPTLSPKTQHFIEERLFAEQTTTQVQEHTERQQLFERQQLEKSFLTTKPAQPEETSNMPRHKTHNKPSNNKYSNLHKANKTAAQTMRAALADMADDEMASAEMHANNAAEIRWEVSESEDDALFLQARRTQKAASEQASIHSSEKGNRDTLMSKETDERYDIYIQSLNGINAIKKQETARALSKTELAEASERAKIETDFTSQRTQFFKQMTREKIETRNLMFISKKRAHKHEAKETSDFVVVEKEKQEPKPSFFSISPQKPTEKHVDPKATAPTTQGWADYFASFLPGRK